MFHKIYIFQVGFPPDLNHVADHFDNEYIVEIVNL